MLLAVATAWGLWLIGAQALLWTPLFKHLLNARGPVIHIEYRFAWSVWPGTVHARERDLAVADSDRLHRPRLDLVHPRDGLVTIW